MKLKLIDVLESFGYPVMLQSSMNADANYPSSFFTYWNNEVTSDGFYDNCDSISIWDYDVNFYSDDPTLVNTKLNEVIKKLKEKGFIITRRYDVMSDEPTHTGRGMNVIYIERTV